MLTPYHEKRRGCAPHLNPPITVLQKLQYWFYKHVAKDEKRTLLYMDGPRAAAKFRTLDEDHDPLFHLPPEFLSRAADSLREQGKTTAANRATQAAAASHLWRNQATDARLHLGRLQRHGQTDTRTFWLELAYQVLVGNTSEAHARLDQIEEEDWLSDWGGTIVGQTIAHSENPDPKLTNRITQLSMRLWRRQRKGEQQPPQQEVQTTNKELDPEEALERELERLSADSTSPMSVSM